MAPASWFLELRLDPATPALSGMGGGRAALTPLGRLMEEAWLDLPVLHGAGIDRFLIEPQGLLALVHWPAPARCRLVAALERRVRWMARASGIVLPGRPWSAGARWLQVAGYGELGAIRERLRRCPAPALRRTG